MASPTSIKPITAATIQIPTPTAYSIAVTAQVIPA